MRFITDEIMGPTVAKGLAAEGHEVFSVYDDSPGIDDEEILQKAYREDFIVITCDKDFGELVFKNKLPHKGVIFLRLNDETPPSKIRMVGTIIDTIRGAIGE